MGGELWFLKNYGVYGQLFTGDLYFWELRSGGELVKVGKAVKVE